MFKRPSNSTNTDKPKSQMKPAKQPPSYEELLRLAQQQKEKKTLQEEIEEEISSKHKVIDKDDLKKREELYQKSLMSKRKSATVSKNSIKRDSIERESDHSSYNNKSNNKSMYPSTSSKYDRLDSKNDQTRFKDKPIPKLSSKVNDTNKESNLESVLSSKPGKLASKIASLSKEQLLELSNAVKKAEKRKSFSKDEEYSPRTNYNDEYKPKPLYKSTTNQPTYVPSKIKNTDHEEYDPMSNYKTSRSSIEQFKKKELPNQVKKPSSRLFDIDSLTPEEIEKIRRERMEKQKKEVAKSSSTQLQRSEKSKPLNKESANRYAQAPRPKPKPMDYLPPIGASYVRGMYDSSYYDDPNEEEYEDEDEDEDDMRDFIDDGDDYKSDELDNSWRDEIDRIFKYNRNKYKDDYDDDIEEASYAQQMMEERRSARIGKERLFFAQLTKYKVLLIILIFSNYTGYMEDLEEERKEEEERRRKAKLKKKGYRISSDEDD